MHDRDAIIAAVDLRALADELLGPHTGTERSPTWRCPNPNHAQTGATPPVTVFTSRRGEPRWRCHGCGDGGTAIDLVMACRGIDLCAALDQLAAHARPAGHTPLDEPFAPPQRVAAPTREAGHDHAGLTAYVNDCTRKLWLSEATTTRHWLTKVRGLPEEVLRTNRIGADLGPRRQPRPPDMCRAGGVVLPVIHGDQVIYAQVRSIRPDASVRYLNPPAAVAYNPRLARYRPHQVRHPEVIVTEGAIDALSANAAGYRAVAILSATYPDRHIAHTLSRLPHPLVIAFDGDDAGRNGAQRLHSLLNAALRPAPILHLDQGDLNDALLRSRDWNTEMSERVAQATEHGRHQGAPTIAR